MLTKEVKMGVGSLVIFLLIGLIAGWLAGVVMKGSGYGVLGDILVGIIGAFVGGFLFSLLGLSATGIMGNIIVAFIGAVVLVWVLHTLHHTVAHA
jgi:uncharacterized membrane protein YeaQ/YmgE (transglycosylase-associated protein family)